MCRGRSKGKSKRRGNKRRWEKNRGSRVVGGEMETWDDNEEGERREGSSTSCAMVAVV